MTNEYQKVVVKVGTNVLTRPDGSLDITNISHLVDQIAEIRKKGVELVLISSGAVGAGRELLPRKDQDDSVVSRQVLSAIGQVRLMEKYRLLFNGHKLLCGQILATKGDFRDREHYLNMRNCLLALLNEGVVPVVNENDTVSVTELMFTDNDELASLVCTMLNANVLIILSSVDGLYNAPPGSPGAELIHELSAKDEAAGDFVAPVKTSFGRGGMGTKLRMAQQTARLGADVILANGRRSNILLDVLYGDVPCTRIRAAASPSNVKKWLAHQGDAKASIQVNAGAEMVLSDAKVVSSLLPIGVIAIVGDFQKGDLVRITNEKEELIGLGVAQYDARQARENMGIKEKKALVHYDYLMMY